MPYIKKEADRAAKEVENLHNKVENLKNKNRQLQKQLEYARDRLQALHLPEDDHSSSSSSCDDELSIGSLRTQLHSVDTEYSLLQEPVTDLSDPVVETYACGKFTDGFRKACIAILEQGVRVSAVNAVITATLKLANKVPILARRLLEKWL